MCVYAYTYACKCVHTHTHIYIYIYIYMCVCVCSKIPRQLQMRAFADDMGCLVTDLKHSFPKVAAAFALLGIATCPKVHPIKTQICMILSAEGFDLDACLVGLGGVSVYFLGLVLQRHSGRIPSASSRVLLPLWRPWAMPPPLHYDGTRWLCNLCLPTWPASSMPRLPCSRQRL